MEQTEEGISLNSDGLDPRFIEFVCVLCHSKMFRFLPLEIHRMFPQVLPASRLVVEIQFPESKISDNSDSHWEFPEFREFRNRVKKLRINLNV